uniref:Uncharacterized protein n=1 Tax=Salix viminalis TaxID=40686 RepID=A0A6N2NM34_SALVM
MGKEDIKLMKLEEINNEDYPKELKEQGAITLFLSCLHTRLTESDLRDDQSKLSMNKADAQNYLYPFLNKDEKVDEGIETCGRGDDLMIIGFPDGVIINFDMFGAFVIDCVGGN